MVDSPGQAVVTSPLLETKLYTPRWRAGLVPRARLTERLDHVTKRKLTLVSAPAGFGKSSLLAEWLTGTPAGERPAAWLSLDPSDNDPALFWAYFVTALQRVHSGVGESALSLLRSNQPPPIEKLLGTLLNEITASSDEPSTGSSDGFVLVLDDYHVIEAQPVHTGISFLLDHLPPQMHLVIAGRADPPLPLSRLRGQGELAELRAADLRFTAEEAAAFLNEVMGLDLSAGDVAALETRTEGWIAGLQLAALSMQGREDVPSFITAFAGDDRYIVDYLVEEVLQRQPEEVRSFLLQTSILDRFSAPLCDAVTGRQDGKAVLEALERGNLFVVPLDDKRQWYRYHHLFGDVLRAHSMEEQPDRVPALHRLAAAWFEERSMAPEAIEQARAAGDHETVARILSANFEDFERTGQYTSISSWSASLPEEMVRKRPRLALIHAGSAVASEDNLRATRRLTAWAEDAIDAIESGGGFDPTDDIDGTVVGPDGLGALKGELLAMKLVHSARKLQPKEIAGIVEQALELLPPGHRTKGMLHMIRAGLQMEASDIKLALPGLDRSVEEARRADNPLLLAGVLTHRGQASVTMGRLEEGRSSFEEAILAAQGASSEATLLMCGPHTGLAEVFLERADLAMATHHAEKALEFAGRSPTRSPVLYARTTAAQVLLAAGDTNAAMEQVEAAQRFVQGSSDSRFVSFLSSVRLKIYCWSGDLEAAADVVRVRELSPDVVVDRDNEEEVTAYARSLVADGDYSDAVLVLSRVLPIVRDGGRVQHEIHALTLQALAHELLGERARALESLGRATMLGEPGRFNRTFTVDGPAAGRLLEALADGARRGRGPAEAGSPSYLANLLPDPEVGPEGTSASASDLAEPLTVRELEVLRLIAAGMRNQNIADQLFISLSTVKRHIANAYGKLDVSHRTEAVARANELNLL